MKFCPQCQSVLSKSTTPAGLIEYRCVCTLNIKGGPNDTLMAEGYLENAESNLKHEVFIENSAFDPAALVVLKDCPNCGLNFLNMVRVGSNETTIYTCSCSYRATHEDYMKQFDVQSAKNESVV
jgi:DNA-directed RNA polymerase subunit M/transcription elongation factor TFIIS